MSTGQQARCDCGSTLVLTGAAADALRPIVPPLPPAPAATLPLPIDGPVNADDFVRLEPGPKVKAIAPDLSSRWGYRSHTDTTLTRPGVYSLIASDNLGNSYWFLNSSTGNSASITIHALEYTTPAGGCLIFGLNYDGEILWTATLMSNGGNAVALSSIVYDGNTQLVLCGGGIAGSMLTLTDTLGATRTTTLPANMGAFALSLTVDGQVVWLTSTKQSTASQLPDVTTDTLDGVMTSYVYAPASNQIVAISNSGGILTTVALPGGLNGAVAIYPSIIESGQGNLYLMAEATAGATIALSNSSTVSVPVQSYIVLIYTIKRGSTYVSMLPAAVWTVVNAVITSLHYQRGRVYIAFTATNNLMQTTINNLPLGNTNSALTELNRIAYIVAMPASIAYSAPMLAGPLPLAIYSTETPDVVANSEYVYEIILTGDGHDTIYATISAMNRSAIPTATATVRVADASYDTPVLARFTADLSLSSAMILYNAVNPPSGDQRINISLTANMRGEVWLAASTPSTMDIEYDALTLPFLAGNGDRSYLLLHASVDTAVPLIGITRSVTNGIAETQWPALAVPMAVTPVGIDLGFDRSATLQPSSLSERILDPSVDSRGSSVGEIFLLTPQLLP